MRRGVRGPGEKALIPPALDPNVIFKTWIVFQINFSMDTTAPYPALILHCKYKENQWRYAYLLSL